MATKPKPEPSSAPDMVVMPPLRMPAPLLAAIDDLASSRGVSRTALACELLDLALRSTGASGVEPSLDQDLAAARRLRWRFDAALADLELSEPEASLICDALNGIADHADAAESTVGPAWLYAEIADSITISRLDRKWTVDAKKLLKRLRSLTPVQAAAVVEATRWFWRFAEADTGLALRAVGLVGMGPDES
jgi:hypothetical protein